MSLLAKLPKLKIIPALSGKPTASVIILHGLGASGSDFQGLVDTLQYGHTKEEYEHIEFVLPEAPVMPITYNHGYPMTGWFDIFSLGETVEEIGDFTKVKGDYEGFKTSIKTIEELIELQMSKGIKSDRIIVGGFSQGAAVSYGLIATSKYKLGGGIIMSGFVPTPSPLEKDLVEINKDTPIIQFHGTSDPVIDYSVGLWTRDYYRSKVGFSNLKFFKYNSMGHSTCADEMDKVYEFIKQTVPK